MYIKINGSDTKYENVSISQFTTQHGNHGVRIIGDVPSTDQGFKVYDDNDTLISDFSDYVFTYRVNEYINVEETVEDATCTFDPLPESAFDRLSSRVSSLNFQVSQITPVSDCKDVYIDDTECIFNLPKNGNINAWLVINDAQIECSYEVIENKIIVTFDPLEYTGKCYISIQ